MLAGLLPAVCALWPAVRPSEGLAAPPAELSAREKVLRSIPGDPAVLINVTAEDLPASPDILNLGRRSTRALERCLADNVDAYVRSTCASILHALGDRRALPTLHAALEDWEPEVRRSVIDAIGAMPDKSSVEPLLRLYARKDEDHGNRLSALAALGAMSDQRVVRLVRAEVGRKPKEGEPDLRPAAFEALWASRHLMARGTLEGDVAAALASDNDSLVLAATEAAAELRAPRLVGALVPLMEHGWPDVRNKAVYALGRIGDRTATKALLAQLPKVRDGRMLNNIAFALERLDKAAFYESIKQVVGHKQAVIRLNAAFVLGDVRHPEGLPLLEQALGDSSDYVRTSAIVAVGKLGITQTGAAQARKALEPFADDPNVNVREEAIYALHALTEGGRADLIYDRLFTGLSPRDHADAIERAAIALGRAGDARVRDYLVACLETFRCEVAAVEPLLRAKPEPRSSGRVLLAWSRGNDGLLDLVSDLRPTGAAAVASSMLDAAWARRAYYQAESAMDVLGSLGDPAVRTQLEPHGSAERTWARLHAAVALARLGDEGAAARLGAEIDNLPAAWLPSYVRLVSRIREPAARARMTPDLERRQASPDPVVGLAAAAIRLRWDPDAAVFRFLEALASPRGDERDLAEYYLSRNREERVTWLLRRALARENRDSAHDRLRALLDRRS